MRQLRLIALILVVAAASACDSTTTTFDVPTDTVSDVPGTVCVAGSTQLCACAGALQGAQVCASDGSAWQPCDCTTPPAVGDVTIELRDPAGAAQLSIAATHIPGETPCVQALGSVFATNGGGTAAALSVVTRSADPTIVFTPGSPVAIDGGAEQTVAITFDCARLTAAPVDIATTVDLFVGDGTSGTGLSFPLSLDFIDAAPPAKVTFTVNDAAGSAVQGIDADHKVGTTDCVQPLGSVMVSNDTDQSADLTFSTRSADPTIEFSASNPVTVAAGASTTVNLQFNCNQLTAAPADISTMVDVAIGGATARTEGFSFPLALTFEFP